MPIVEQNCINAIEGELKEEGFDLAKAPHTKKFISIIVKNVLAEVKKAEVSVPALGLNAPNGAVTGNAKGTIK